MVFSDVEGVIVVKYDKHEVMDANVIKIAKNTSNTWQKDRSNKERTYNTGQGKIAERIVYSYLTNNFANLSVVTYDSIRTDDFKKHAPFDLMINRAVFDNSGIIQSIKKDIGNTQKNYVCLSDNTIQLSKNLGAKFVEVKSTQIRENLKKDCSFTGEYEDKEKVSKLIKKIKENDDFLIYPFFKRYEDRNNDYTLYDYCEEFKKNVPRASGLTGDKLYHIMIENERQKKYEELFIRVYLDLSENIGLIIGWISLENFLDDDVTLKRMAKKEKSEDALYFSKSLENASPIYKLGGCF